jgi:hypothetical protein
MNDAELEQHQIIMALQRDQCPDCKRLGFVGGPRGGAGQNIFCANCGAGFNVALPRSIVMAERIPARKPTDDTEEHPKIKQWVDGWMTKVRERAAVYRQQGMSAEDAEDRAVLDIRMEIRRGPPPFEQQ